MKWRLLRQSEHTAAWNMALDQAIVEAVMEGLVAPTLRVYGWADTSVTVGRFQDVRRDIDVAYCTDRGIPIVRRPTGGRGILHGSDITVTVATRSGTIADRPLSVAETYMRLSEGYVDGLRQLGIPLRLGACSAAGQRSGDCFQSGSKADLLGPNGAKIVGSAMRRIADAILMQSSLRHGRPEVDPAVVFRGARVDAGYPLEDLSRDDIVEAILRGFCIAQSVSFMVGDVTGWEEERAATLMSSLVVTENEVYAKV